MQDQAMAVQKLHALSIKQPWATLLVAGLKTIEIRRWATRRTGRVLIHTGAAADDRPEGWSRVPAHLKEMAQLRGGVLGAAQLTRCVTYRSVDAFAKDQELHLNDPAWFLEPKLHGFVFAQAEALPFHRCPGWLHFFEIELPVPGN
jgi:hypothetical protein